MVVMRNWIFKWGEGKLIFVYKAVFQVVQVCQGDKNTAGEEVGQVEYFPRKHSVTLGTKFELFLERPYP